MAGEKIERTTKAVNKTIIVQTIYKNAGRPHHTGWAQARDSWELNEEIRDQDEKEGAVG